MVIYFNFEINEYMVVLVFVFFLFGMLLFEICYDIYEE